MHSPKLPFLYELEDKPISLFKLCSKDSNLCIISVLLNSCLISFLIISILFEVQMGKDKSILDQLVQEWANII